MSHDGHGTWITEQTPPCRIANKKNESRNLLRTFIYSYPLWGQKLPAPFVLDTYRQVSSLCELCRRKFRQRIISSVVDCRRNPRDMRISSVVLCRRMAGRGAHSGGGGGGRPHGLGSLQMDTILMESKERMIQKHSVF